ncbi:Y-family DNA polymerase [Aestuariirhabdus sp. LZHN29]|uniref:Y-family DNA polymerase n=1 Tax=Aestuariirhabdus sp. LZHN29 TaxID=3417462 RepID=UPI003CEC6C5E
MGWLYLHFYRLELDLARAEFSPDAPLALINSAGGQLLSVNEAASAQGVRCGMSVADAMLLAPRLRLCDSVPLRAHRALEAIAASLLQRVADIALDPPSGLSLDVGGMLRLYGDIDALWSALKPLLVPYSFQYSGGCSPLQARLLARAGRGGCYLDKSRLCDQLDALPVDQADLPGKSAQTLQRVGVRSLGQLRRLPRGAVGRRFGRPLLQYLERLQGRVPESWPRFVLPDRFDRSIEFYSEVEFSSGLLFPIQRLVGELASYLHERQRQTDLLCFELLHRQQVCCHLHVHCAQPDDREALLMRLSRMKLESIQLRAPVMGVRLRVDHLHARGANQGELFSATAGGAQEAAQLVSLLRARLGDGAVHGIACREDYRPERAWESVQPGRGGASQCFSPRPAWLLVRSRSVDVREYQVFAGAERIVSGWWDGEMVRRDYYIARGVGGQLCWLYCDAGKQWYLQGYFA